LAERLGSFSRRPGDLGDTVGIKSIDDLGRTVYAFAVVRGVKLKPRDTEAGMRVRGPIP
jgi:hypothetical protein